MNGKVIIAAAVLNLIALPAVAAVDAEAGKGIVESQCRSCHFSDVVPPADGVPPGFRDIIQQRKLTRNAFRHFVTEPHYPMPPKPLSLSQIEDLVAYFDSAGYWP
jgi:cytochrome c